MATPDHRSSLANTAIWTCALAAIVMLTIWKFELWPISWVATETGSLETGSAHAERFAVAPIQVAGSADEPDVHVEPTAGQIDPESRPAELAALNLENALPTAPDRAPPKWVSEPGRLPVGETARLLRQAPQPLPAGTDFGDTGRFPNASAPPRTPPKQSEPNPLPPHPTEPDAASTTKQEDTAMVAVPAQSISEPTTTNITTVGNLSSVDPAAETQLAAIDADIAENRYLAAHKALSKLYWDYPSIRPVIQSRIDKTASSIYFDPQPHYMSPYVVQPGDQLRLFARQYNVPWEYLARLNRIEDPSHIRDGQNLKVIKGPFSAVVDLSDYTLTLHAHGYYVKSYPVGVGKDGTTPVGAFKVILKESNPKYWGSDGVVMERDDPENPLGERWLGLDDGEGNPTSYGIHGTIDPGSVGKAESRGCVRLRNEDVAEIYDILGVGSEVVIQR